MADSNSDLIAAKLAARTGLANGIVNGDDAGGILTFYNVEVACGASVAANDTFQLIDLPPGAVIVPELSSITASGDPGTPSPSTWVTPATRTATATEPTSVPSAPPASSSSSPRPSRPPC
jgi:hypothetical protein